MFFLLILIVLILLFYKTFVKPMGYWKSKRVKEGNPIWIFGNFSDLVFNRKCANDVIYPLYNKYKKERYFGVHYYNKPILVVKDVEIIKNICVKDFEHFSDHRSLIPDGIDPMFTKNLFSLKGNRWRAVRRILTPAFTTSKLKAMLEIMDECANDAINFYLDKYQGVIEIELYDTFCRYCNDVVMNTAFGVKVDSFRNPDNEFYQMTNTVGDFSGLRWILQFFTINIAPQIYKLLKIPIFDKKLVTFYENLITHSINARKAQGIVRNDLIQLFMAANKRTSLCRTLDGPQKKQEVDIDADSSEELDMAEMLAQSSAFVVGGVDSVASLMCFISYELALNQEIQEKLRDEITNTLLEYDGKITYEGLLSMEYLDAVVNEVSRLWPGDLILDRMCTKTYRIQPDHPDEEPLQLEPGDVVWLPVHAIQRDPKYFQDPERFDPERFLSENKANINPYTYFPFGLGPRICIGVKFSMLECKVFICHLLKHFKIVPVPKSQIPVQFVGHVFQYEVKDGFWFGLQSLKE